MTSTRSIRVRHTFQRGVHLLDKEALHSVKAFVASQMVDGVVFTDKAGKAYLYCTSCGWLLAHVLRLKIDTQKGGAFIETGETSSLDLIHYAAYVRCRMLLALMKEGKIAMAFKSYLGILETMDLSRMPNDGDSPYALFVRLSMYEDGRLEVNREALLEALSHYSTTQGGYSNRPNSTEATTNATAAAAMVQGQLVGYASNRAVAYLCQAQDTSGGFRATASTPIPDILSTATALFALKQYRIAPKYSVQDFVEAHWLENGGFAATLLDDCSDIEYTFYGLLALVTL